MQLRGNQLPHSASRRRGSGQDFGNGITQGARRGALSRPWGWAEPCWGDGLHRATRPRAGGLQAPRRRTGSCSASSTIRPVDSVVAEPAPPEDAGRVRGRRRRPDSVSALRNGVNGPRVGDQRRAGPGCSDATGWTMGDAADGGCFVDMTSARSALTPSFNVLSDVTLELLRRPRRGALHRPVRVDTRQ